jgi:hypothetical protein
MYLRQLLSGSAASIVGAGFILASVASAQAIMLPARTAGTSSIVHVDCAIGAHIGPIGGCIIGNDNPPPQPVVVEHRAADVPIVDAPPPADAPAAGCASKSVTRTDGVGNSETKTATNC